MYSKFLRVLNWSVLPVSCFYFKTSLCVMVFVIITSERRFALPKLKTSAL